MFTREDYKLFDKHFDHHYFFDAAGKQLKHPSDIIHNIDDIPSYIKQYRDLIKTSRIDMTPESQAMLLDINTPSILTPDHATFNTHSRYHVGVVLVHGTVESPYALSDIAAHLQSRGILTFSVALPASSTTTITQKYVTAKDMLSFVKQAVSALAPHVEHIVLLGHSMGGLLSTLATDSHPKIRGTVLISPALKVKNKVLGLFYLDYLIKHRLLKKNCRFVYPWIHPATYLSSTYNIDYKMMRLSFRLNNARYQRILIKKPLCIAFTDNDEYLDTHYLMNIIAANQNKKTRLLIYGNKTTNTPRTKNITLKSNTYPDLNIIDFSHISLIKRIDNPLYGPNTHYPMLTHYNFQLTNELLKRPTVYGSANRQNLQTYFLQRLTFNPDFDYFTDYITRFINDVVSDA